jgi:DNA mismatch repair protein MutS2
MHLYPATLADDLDFDVIKQQLSGFCQTPMAKLLVKNLAPYSRFDLIESRLLQTSELLSLSEAGINFPSTLFESISASANLLKTPGIILESEKLAEIRSACITYEQVYVFCEKKKASLKEIWALLANQAPEKYITAAISQVLDERGVVKSSASKALGKIRTDLGKSRAAADRIFNRALKRYQSRGLLMDFNESVSENRRVLAVQSSYKGQVQGIFHGSSNKHSAIYVEPGETVEVNNQIAYLIDEERQEIRRILKDLCKQIAPYSAYFTILEKRLVTLDFIKAKANFAQREEATMPLLKEKGETELLNAYNPVLKIFNRTKEKPTVPLELRLDETQRIIVISGPNAGGKSITLKTLGLLQIMVQSGLLIPVNPSSQFRIYKTLLGDIGDNQSIENELSTYSSKLEKMKYFLQHANDESLLLVDEFGSGSDPQLGSSLAQVFLKKLNKFGTYGIFTTHYNAIKVLASKQKGIVNAAMLFNKKTFSPEYRLEVGHPGSSYTFEVAERTGIPKHIINEARQITDDATLKVDKLLVEIQEDKLQLENTRERLNEELRKLKALERERLQTIEKMEEKLGKQAKQNEENDRKMYWGVRFQKLVESWLDQKTQKDKKAIVARFIGILNQRAGEVVKEEKKSYTKAEKRLEKKLDALKQAPVSIGDKVRVVSSKLEGTIEEIKGDKYKVVIGGIMVSWLSREQFIDAAAKLESNKKPRASRKKPTKKKGTSQKSDEAKTPKAVQKTEAEKPKKSNPKKT